MGGAHDSYRIHPARYASNMKGKPFLLLSNYVWNSPASWEYNILGDTSMFKFKRIIFNAWYVIDI